MHGKVNMDNKYVITVLGGKDADMVTKGINKIKRVAVQNVKMKHL